ncbi:MAG: T9SS type A sorting domain-containing protein [Bacteroidota bacterium]|nr:T9SS type A sorting domain-containing protein [Bacteroidota bacterium]
MVESADPVGDTTSGMVYRFYVHTDDASDKLSAVYGSDSSPLVINTPDGIFNSVATSGASAEGLTEFLLGFFPDTADDSYVTVNLAGPASASGISGAAAPQVIEDITLTHGITAYFSGDNDGTLVEVNTLVGGSWFLPGDAGNASPDSDGRWLIAQITTAGEIFGSINVQIFPMGIQSASNVIRKSFDFNGVGEYFSTEILGCMDETACNYNPEVTEDDGSCTQPDECGVCGGTGIPEGECDCEGTLIDECGVCGGSGIPEGQCDCDGTLIDAIGVCGGDCPSDVNFNGICDDEEIYGCMIDLACNYNPEATINDSSCDFTSCLAFGCNDPSACNFDPEVNFNDGTCVYAQAPYDCDGNCVNDADDDGVCDELEIPGCQDVLACNYNAEATDPPALGFECTYALELYQCDGTCINDADGDGVCDELEVAGCQISTACNFNTQATDPAECLLADDPCESCSGEFDGTGVVIVSDEDGDGVCDADEVVGCQDAIACDYNPAATDSAACDYDSCQGCTSDTACNYDATATQDDGSCVFADDACEECAADGTVLLFDVDGDGVCDQDETVGCLNPLACNYNEYVSEDDGSCEFVSCLVLGCTLDGACNFNPDANINDGSCEYFSCQGCLNPDACNYDETATIAGICDYASCVGCLDPEADNYDATATIEGACDYLGCTSFTACNFDPNANVSDGSCEFLSCVGCLNSLACNYDSTATQPGSCIFPVPGLNCDGTCIDTDMDGVCDEDEVLGCTDETALNYDPAATEDAGNCVLPVGGCTDPSACNYDASANTNDGSCDFESCFGCLNELACNYDAGATYPDASQCDFETCYGCMDSMACNYDDTASFDDGSCDFVTCAGCTNAMACNYDETATIDDGSCDLASCYGCTDASLNAVGGFNACNYDETATFDDGSCEYPANYPDNSFYCDGSCVQDADGDGVCDFVEVGGCMDEMACNYNPAATDDDGSCDFAVPDCTVCVDGASTAIDTDGDGVGDCDEVSGCTDAMACNYDMMATDDEGSCDVPVAGCEDCVDGESSDIDTEGEGVVDCDEVSGCTDSMACNYDMMATDDDGSCDVPVAGCQECVDGASADIDTDGDGVADCDEILGCMDSTACNYDMMATDDNGSCDVPVVGCEECVDGASAAIDSDGDGVANCDEILGCMDTMACNYDMTATDDDGSCDVPVEGCEECVDGASTAIDTDGDGVADCDEVLGCMDTMACNYDMAATDDDGSCDVPVEGCEECVDGASTAIDTDGDGVADCDEILGCMDTMACNYDMMATDDDGSCDVPVEGCEECVDGASAAIDTDGDGVADCDEILGCTDSMACNYDEVATDDDGSCEYTTCAGCTDSVALNYDETATIDDGSCEYCDLVLTTEVLQAILCEGAETGVVELTLGNVVYPDSITIELNGVVQDTTVFEGLGAGAYTVLVSQGADCDAIVDFELQDGTALLIDIETSEVTCAGDADGSIDASALSGVLPIEYVLTGPVSETNNTGNFDDLPGGSYTLNATDGNGCTFEEVIEVAEPEALSLDVVVTDAAEEGNGAIDLTVEGGTEPYEFDWTSSGSFTSDEEDISELEAPFFYSVTVTDANGCEAEGGPYAVDDVYGLDEAGQLVFVAYPNPAMDWVAVELENGAMAADIMVFDNTGRVVTQLPFNGTRLVLDVANWSAGTYHLQVSNAQTMARHQIMIQR